MIRLQWFNTTEMSNLENVKENKVKLDDIENDRESSQTKYKKTS